MKFAELSQYFEKLESTPSRLAMTDVLVELYKKAAHDEVAVIVNLSLGQLRAKFDRLEFSLAEKMVMRAVGEAFGVEVDGVKKTYKSLGDIGETTQKLKTQNSKLKAATKNLKVTEVYERLVRIAEDEGEGSQERKVSGLAELLQGLDAESGKYVARMIVGKLRLGFSDMTILDALSFVVAGDKSKRKVLENAYQLRPDVGYIAELVMKSGVEGIEDKVAVELGVPVVPALAQRLKTANEMIEKMGKVAVEAKYDGTRVQMHLKRGKDGFVRTFTRNLDETTHMFPELQALGEHVKGDELILDSEGIAYDPKTGKLRPFQDTIQRKRKHGIEKAAQEIPLKFFVFDVLYKDGESLVKKPFYERRKMLEKVIKENKVLELPEMIVTEDARELREFHKKQLEQGYEGALVKKWDGVYEPGRRGWSWVKFKEEETSKAKLADTVDGLVMGLYRGRGKRTAFGVGAFLVGIRGDATSLREERGEAKEGMFYTMSKVGTGLTDEQWRELARRGKEFEVKEKPAEYEVHKDLVPDVWLSPGLVVEIAADEITKSPNHTLGLALRFPRLVKFRDDKGSGQVTSVSEVKVIGGI